MPLGQHGVADFDLGDGDIPVSGDDDRLGAEAVHAVDVTDIAPTPTDLRRVAINELGLLISF